MADLHSTGHDKWGTSIDEQVNCKVSDGLILPSAMGRSSGPETQTKPNDADPKIRNVTHGLIIYNMPEILEGTPAESRTHDAQAISEVFERILAPSESVKILRTSGLRSAPKPTLILHALSR